MRRTLAHMILVAVLLASPLLCLAQTRHTFGIRIGNGIIADYKASFTPSSSIDANLGVVNIFNRSYQFLLVSTAYHHNFATPVPRLSPYVGGGFSAGVQFGQKGVKLSDKKSPFLSVDLPLGLEYALYGKPVVIMFEWSPKLQLLGPNLQIAKDIGFIYQSISAGVRFIFR